MHDKKQMLEILEEMRLSVSTVTDLFPDLDKKEKQKQTIAWLSFLVGEISSNVYNLRVLIEKND
jgi:hypothetical protein